MGGPGDVPSAASVCSGERADGLEKLTDHGGFPGSITGDGRGPGSNGLQGGKLRACNYLKKVLCHNRGRFFLDSDENRWKLRGVPVELSEIDSAGWL